MALIDISPAISPQSPVFPGDTSFHSSQSWSIAGGAPVNVSTVTLSTHTGAHADAPLHYQENAQAIDAVELEPYIGHCVIIDVTHLTGTVTKRGLAEEIAKLDFGLPPRVILKTYNAQPMRWDADFTALAPDAIHLLADRNVILIGVDTHSLDPAASKTMDAHKAVYARDMRILEGLCLDHAPAGRYELIAPPLKLQGLDAAPVRAVLRTLT